MQLAQPILWDIYETHLDEAAFLWSQWERSLAASNYTLNEVARGPEERLLAHLDGLVLGGQAVAERLLLPALGSEDPACLSDAAWVLLHADAAAHFEAVWESLETATDLPRRRAISRALELSQRPDLPRRLVERLPAAPPELKACLLDAIAAHGPTEVAGLSFPRLASEAPPELLGAVLRGVQRVPDPAYAHLIERGLASGDPETRAAAIEAATLSGLPGTRAICRRAVAERAADQRLAMAVLGLGDEAKDRARLLDWSKTPDLATLAIWAFGFTGRIEVAEHLLTLLDDEQLAPSAADSFCTITGLVLDGPFSKAGQRVIIDTPSDADAPVPDLAPEDDLPTPRADAVRAWWERQRGAFDADARYLLGVPWTERSVHDAMSRVATWRRRALRLALGANAAGTLDVTQWARRQRA